MEIKEEFELFEAFLAERREEAEIMEEVLAILDGIDEELAGGAAMSVSPRI